MPNWVPKSISVLERLSDAAWVYAVRRTALGPMVQLDWTKPSSVGVEEAVKLRVRVQEALGSTV